jgi:localization factor PodJL
MSQKRSHLDSLNAGRQRRQSTSIERLNRTLEELEGRIERMPRDEGWQHRAGADERAATAYARRSPASPYRDYPGDLRSERGRNDDAGSFAPILAELQNLRMELSERGDGGVSREVAALRRDIERVARPGRQHEQAESLNSELERLSAMIEQVANRGDDRTVGMLRHEIGQIKAALGELAREDTVRTVGQRWEELDRRWDALAHDLRLRDRQQPRPGRSAAG